MDRRLFIATMGSLSLTLISGCSRGRTNAQSGNLVDVASAYPDLTTFVSVVQTAGLTDTLRTGVFTVFAPTNAAFAALPEGTMSSLAQPQNRELLVRLLGYHALPRVAPSSQFAGQQLNVVTAEGQSVRIDGKRGRVTVNDANVLNADIRAANGLIHVVDRVLVP